MSGFSARSITFMLFIAFLVWSSSFDTCIARRGRHWRQTRSSSVSLYKKKGKNHSNHHHNVKSKSKSSPHKAPSPPLSRKAPSPPPPNNPKDDDIPPPPPQKGYGSPSRSSVFNVLDFGAKGNGNTDDTKVCP